MSSSPSLFELAAREHIASRGAKGTKVLYSADLERWLGWCEANKVDPAKPKLLDASTFRDGLLDGTIAAQPQQPLTVRRTLASLSAMYSHAVNKETPSASWNPFKAVPKPSADSFAQTEAAPEEDVKKILAVVEADKSKLGARDLAILLVMSETGLRRKSVAEMRRDSLFKRGSQAVASVIVKGGKRKQVELNERVAAALDAWLEVAPSSPHVFPALRGKKSLTPDAINKIVAERSRQAKVEGIHPHSFRAAFATSALDAGVPLHEVQAAMHHRDPKTTLRYDTGERGVGVAAAVAKFRKKKKP